MEQAAGAEAQIKVFQDPKIDTVKEIARMLKQGMTSPEIAEELGIKPSTVRSYIHDYQLK